jgi:glycosyltransferase involved in cell wall biosynthesis
MTDPYFSVVMATFNRGDHIRPSIESVLQQSFGDFELLVIGDACTDDTEAVVGAFKSSRVVWRNLKRNSGGQSGPNNDGIRRARGKWICYIGHDDIWRPDHLSQFKQAIDADTGTDFVVGGCIWHGPPGSDTDYVTGLFDTPEAAYHNLFPPSSIGHRREVVERIGGWRAPRCIPAPADCDFMLRAVHAGFRFVSTGQISVHKFAAGHRYLYYLRPDSAEQAAMLSQINRGDSAEIEWIVERSKQHGLFMTMRYVDFSKNKLGAAYAYNRRNKGLSRPGLRPLTGRVVIPQADDPRALDWHPRDEPNSRHRWSGPNPNPKILIPYTGGRTRFAVEVIAHKAAPALYSVSIGLEGTGLRHVVETSSDGSRWLVFDADLKASDATILTLRTPAMFRPSELYGNKDLRYLGIPVADIMIEPWPPG